MRTVKLVVIGASGVGKSSIRNQVSLPQEFSQRVPTFAFRVCSTSPAGSRRDTGRRLARTSSRRHFPTTAIRMSRSRCKYGCVVRSYEGFYCRVFGPDPTRSQDTAGQERFSGLSSAFFRGADAVILMFDVNQPHTLGALTKWWDNFRDKAPVPDDRVEEFCCIVVGNKIDVVQEGGVEGLVSGGSGIVTPAEARAFIQTIAPHPTTPPSLATDLPSQEILPEHEEDSPHSDDGDLDTEFDAPTSASIEIGSPHVRRGRGSYPSRSQSRSTLFRGGGTVGTMTTTHSIYHTPSSSIYDTFQSALSSQPSLLYLLPGPPPDLSRHSALLVAYLRTPLCRLPRRSPPVSSSAAKAQRQPRPPQR